MFEFGSRLPSVDPAPGEFEQHTAQTAFGWTLRPLDDVQVVHGGHRPGRRGPEIGRLFTTLLAHPLTGQRFCCRLVELWCEGDGSNRRCIAVVGRVEMAVA